MTQVTEAIYSDGVLKPEGCVVLRDQERVRVIIQSLEALDGHERERAIQELFAGIGKTGFRSRGPYPSRDELHERR